MAKITAKLVVPLGVLWCLLFVQSCNDNGQPTAPTTGAGSAITVTPARDTLLLGEAQQFTAQYKGDAGQQFQWSIVRGPGSMSAAGLYTAPDQLAIYSMTATVRVTLANDTTKVGYAQIVVLGENTGSGSGGNGGGGGGGGGGGTPKDTTVCFQRDILPILQSNCAMSGCHDSQTREEGIELTSFQTMMASKGGSLVRAHNPEGSKLYEAITEDKPKDMMPPPPRTPLSAEQIALIRRWIVEGATNRDCSNEEPECDMQNITYSKTIVPILRNNCLGCHSGTAPVANLSLEGYSNVQRVAANGKLVGVVTHAQGFPSMPPVGSLSNCAIEQIQQWVQAGAPNN